MKHRIILHIDDDEEDRDVLMEALKKLDAEIIVRQAESGNDALSILNRSRDMGELPCLIVLDMNLPGMKGEEILKQIKKDKTLASVPLIVFSTASRKSYEDLIAKEKLVFITKPMSPDELKESAKKMLRYCPCH